MTVSDWFETYRTLWRRHWRPGGRASENMPNPFKVFGMLNRRQWALFLISFCSWTCDAIDFFSVSLTVTHIRETLNKHDPSLENSDVTWGITLTLMLRSVGAFVFGLISDRFGRKWPLVINLILIAATELATGFIHTFSQFLGVRALFGIFMGGLFGMCASVLEDLPMEARGVMSGILQQGYAFGYLLATVFNQAVTPNTAPGWRSLFYLCAGISCGCAAVRSIMPENDTFLRHKEARKTITHEESDARAFLIAMRAMLKNYWKIFIYLVLLMAGFNFMSHGSQDLYPTFLENSLSFDQARVTVTQVVANLGAIAGGTTVGYVSQWGGRRTSIIIMSIIGGCLLPAYVLPRNNGIMAAAFFEQFCVQGAWGVVPIHLVELSPVQSRALVTGLSYQLGNLVSSASSTIESTIGERFKLGLSASGEMRYDYGKVIAIFMGCVYGYVIIVAFLGIERRGEEGEEMPQEEHTGDDHADAMSEKLEKDERIHDENTGKTAQPLGA